MIQKNYAKTAETREHFCFHIVHYALTASVLKLKRMINKNILVVYENKKLNI